MLRFTNIDHKPTKLPPIYGYRTHPVLPLRQALEPLLSQINELDEFIRIAKKECHFPSEHGLTREESASIYIYTMDWGEQSLYRVLNDILRVKDRSVLVPWHGYLKLFDTALKKLPNRQMILWRGINVDISKNFKEGEELTWWSFNSCSSSVKVVKQFLGSVSTLLMIEAKNGKAISSYSNFPEENEVILGLGTQLRVMSDPLDHSSLNVVHLVELSDENEEDLTSSLAAVSINQSAQTKVHASANQQSSSFKVKVYDDGSRYEGEWKNEKKHGNGTYYFANGDKYTGDWVEGSKEGEGVFIWTTGNRYEGQWKNGKKNGKGTKFFASGEKYTGDWVDDKQEGEGVYTWPTGTRYEGQWKNSNMNGKGTKFFASGNKYTGDWVDNKKEGEGVYTWPNGNRYEGQWKNDNMNGKGTKFFASGEKYTGDWVDDKKEGEGVFTWADGDRYEGQYKNGKRDGRGKMRLANGVVTKNGMWSNDTFIG